jgi:hypothetical protein
VLRPSGGENCALFRSTIPLLEAQPPPFSSANRRLPPERRDRGLNPPPPKCAEIHLSAVRFGVTLLRGATELEVSISLKAAGLLLVGCLICEGNLVAQVRSGGSRGGFSRGGSRAGAVSRSSGVGRISSGRPSAVGDARATGSSRGAPGRTVGGSIAGRGLPSIQRTPRRTQSRVIQPSAPAQKALTHGLAAQPASRRRGASIGGAAGFPGTDRVVTPRRPPRRSHGNVIAPGTPGRIGNGNVITPGTPRRSAAGLGTRGARGRGVQSKMLSYGQDFGQGPRYVGVPVVYVPYGYARQRYEGDYEPRGYEEESPYVYRVDPETATESGADYVIRVESDEESAPPESAVYEVRPAEEAPVVEPQDEGESPSAEESEAASEATLYLVALDNGNIYTSTEHWIESDALHYITRGGAHNLVSVEEVDMELTARLNRERGLAFVIEVREALP